MTFLLLLLLLVAVVAAVGAFRPAWYGRGASRRVVEEIVYDEPVEVLEDDAASRPLPSRHRRRRVIEY